MGLDEIRSKARCAGCQGRIGRRLNLVALNRVASWDYPCSGNVLTGEDHQAVAVMCDGCCEANVEPQEAIEFCAGEVIYHAVDTLAIHTPPQRRIRWFRNSPDEGQECICSWCDKAIMEPFDEDEADDGDWPAIRMWNRKKNLEARFHPSCFNETIEAGQIEISN